MAFRRLAPLLLAVAMLASQALATWSIVVVNRRTGEVCIASATCLENFNLRNGIGLVSVEVGAGATQSLAVSSVTRKLMHDLLEEGVPPQEILDIIAPSDPLWPIRQIGLVDLAGRAVTYSGPSTGQWSGGVTGEFGDYVYAIQGNVLTGAPVVQQCEAAFLATPGDLGQRVMAAMEAARLMGGDGRCSCSQIFPTQCGSPPPNFTKSAHVAFFLIARPGEEEICTNSGCAGGDFYLAINKATLTAADPDPVLLLRQDFDAWRLGLQGRPDAIHSTVWPAQAATPAGSTSPLFFELDLADVDGQPLQAGGATVTMIHDPRSAGLASLGQVVDHGDGTYTVEVIPGAGAGLDLLRFVVDDGVHAVTLWPPASLLHDPGPSAPLRAGEAIPGLAGLAAPRAATLSADRLTAWLVADAGAGVQLFTVSRPLPDAPFGAPAAVDLGGFAIAQITDLAASADGLRLIFSAEGGASGVPHLWSASRASAAVGFDPPAPIADLDSRAGEKDPALSANELELVFASRRDGGWDLWRARRLTPTARFFPPEKLESLSLPFAGERAPQYDEGGTRLWFARREAAGAERLMSSALRADGSYAPAAPAAGVFAGAGGKPVAAEAGEGPLWILGTAPGGAALRARPRAHATLIADAASLSASLGGTLGLDLDAGPEWAGAAYRITVGAPGVTVLDADEVVLPFARDARLDAWTVDPANAALLPGFSGALDAQGRATAQWILPAGSLSGTPLIGRSFALGAVAVLAGERFLSSAAPFALQP